MVLLLSFPVIHRHVSYCLCFMNWALLRAIRVSFRWQLCDLPLWLLGSGGFAPGPWASGESPGGTRFRRTSNCQVLESNFRKYVYAPFLAHAILLFGQIDLIEKNAFHGSGASRSGTPINSPR